VLEFYEAVGRANEILEALIGAPSYLATPATLCDTRCACTADLTGRMWL
jgi:hypothetical protein